jgi:hypothetical protein
MKDSYEHLLVRISDCTVILQYNWQSVKCQVIKENTVTAVTYSAHLSS